MYSACADAGFFARDGGGGGGGGGGGVRGQAHLTEKAPLSENSDKVFCCLFV